MQTLQVGEGSRGRQPGPNLCLWEEGAGEPDGVQGTEYHQAPINVPLNNVFTTSTSGKHQVWGVDTNEHPLPGWDVKDHAIATTPHMLGDLSA